MPKDKTFGPGIGDNGRRYAVGIDQSYSGFGITIIDIDNPAKWETVVFHAPGAHIDRLVWIKRNLEDSLDLIRHGVDDIRVAMEGYAYGSQMSHMLGELGAIVKLTCFEVLSSFHGCYPYIVAPATLKKFATGKGTGIPKSAVMMHVYKKWGVEFTDDNAADSYVLARIASGLYDTEYEHEIITKIQDPKYREKP